MELHFGDAVAAQFFQSKRNARCQPDLGVQNHLKCLLPLFGLLIACDGQFQGAPIAQIIFEGTVELITQKAPGCAERRQNICGAGRFGWARGSFCQAREVAVGSTQILVDVRAGKRREAADSESSEGIGGGGWRSAQAHS